MTLAKEDFLLAEILSSSANLLPLAKRLHKGYSVRFCILKSKYPRRTCDCNIRMLAEPFATDREIIKPPFDDIKETWPVGKLNTLEEILW